MFVGYTNQSTHAPCHFSFYMPQAPLTDARNWIPVICGCMLLTVASMIYESHESYKLFAFIGVLVAASMIFFMIYLMKDFASLNVNGAALVYTIWLIRGTMITAFTRKTPPTRASSRTNRLAAPSARVFCFSSCSRLSIASASFSP